MSKEEEQGEVTFIQMFLPVEGQKFYIPADEDNEEGEATILGMGFMLREKGTEVTVATRVLIDGQEKLLPFNAVEEILKSGVRHRFQGEVDIVWSATKKEATDETG